jgi:purine-binding chemotaxis protein CheW
MAGTLLKLLTIRLGNRSLGIDVMAVRELRAYAAPAPLPHAPRDVRGMLNLRGTILPVIDLAARLGWPPSEPGQRSVIVVVSVGSEERRQLHGLVVDAVTDIIEITDEQIQPVPDEFGGAAGPISGLVPIERDLLMLLPWP